MRNPWLDLPQSPDFVLPCDEPVIAAHNATASRARHVDLRLMPEPFMGSPDAMVLALALNPGISPRDRDAHGKPAFQSTVRRNLAHEPLAYPHYYVEPGLRGPGADWWRRVAGQLVGSCGAENVGRRLLCVEYFPYHSRTFDHSHLRLPSQEYGFSLVRAAMQRGADIIVMRGFRIWAGAVPELSRYERVHRLSNPRNVALTRGNLGRGWDPVCQALST